MSDTSGRTSRTPFAYYDRDGSCWRTSQGTFPWDSGTFSGTWPRWGMTQGGESFELPTPAHPTTAPASSSLLPTPVADHSRGLPQPGTDYQSLPNVAAQLLPTPAVNDMGANKTPAEWDAWTAKMQERHGNGNGHGPSLSIEAQRLLPTPTAQDAVGSRQSTHLRGTGTPWTGDTLTDVFWKQAGVSTGRPSADGNTSSDDPHQPPLSQDETDPD